MTASQTASRRNIDNTPDESAIAAMRDLAINVLEPIRVHFNAPVIVSSGYRGPRLNRAIGGSKTSDHMYGRAADISVHGVSDRAVCEFIIANLDFKQLILEFPPSGWVHVSYLAGGNKGQVLTARRQGGRTVYLKGIS